ncbi:MAG: hypothetical protein TR69_WS6001000800 [candidate division WS6 bacterium OLB20]|uniref:Uncharacterized protein n=1 Tax=candidate division WS6 bacterium OLB20 TaxID=1617426 RepID=A0A136LYP9_9BACT|nr:MAG: hypothetical protein TR69_WS6001000800 [candidate division WS6 bacterium OLB20]
MKLVRLLINSVLKHPFAALKLISLRPSEVSLKRFLSVFVTASIAAPKNSFYSKDIVRLCQLTLIPFIIDSKLDESNYFRFGVDLAIEKLQKDLEVRINDLKLSQEETQVVNKEIRNLIAHDFLANESDTISSYLMHSTYTIGLIFVTRSLTSVHQDEYDLGFLIECSKLIRYLSDRATIEKDKSEKRNNLSNYINKQEINHRIYTSSKKIEQYKITSVTEQFLYNIAKLSLIFYKNKDFEYV